MVTRVWLVRDNMLNDIDVGRLRQSIKNQSWLWIDEAFRPEFGWELPVYYLEYCADREIGTPTGVMSYKLEDGLNVKDIDYVAQELNKILVTKITSADMFLSFANRSTADKTENRDVILWQPLGSIDVIVHENNSNITKTVNPGDLVYLPSFVSYDVKLNGARTTIAFYMGEPDDSEAT